MKLPNLTPAQRNLLIEVSNGDDRCSDAYLPAVRLVEMGLCIWQSANRLALTPAGRSALSHTEGSAER